MHLHPDKPIKCLLVQPRFSAFSFWNYVEACKVVGAKTPMPPLGLITVAALLPQHWSFKLMDLNCAPFDDALWQWADMICVGGMLPQQVGILDIIARAQKDGKYVAVGGSDPSSQPAIYDHADALIVGEGESAIPVWLASWRQGAPKGIFKETEKPDVTTSPVPRFDLLKIADYEHLGVQYSRGCPFNCEFCDIIELFGRKPRTKTVEQICLELDAIKATGYGGSVDLVDDNLIGNIRNVKRALLPALIEWNKKNGNPFYYVTEASMNLADDDKLLELMREAEFRFVFMGIETPDPDLLLMTQKTQNTTKPIAQRVNRLFRYGIIPMAGFIMGFDGEKPGMDKRMIELIDACSINMSMVGLLVALPNTQLTRRLLKEGRLLSFNGERITEENVHLRSAKTSTATLEIVDQTVAGLNFLTTRSRLEILTEFENVLRQIYSAEAYFKTVSDVIRKLRIKSKHKPRWFEIKRQARGLAIVLWRFTVDAEIRPLFWKNVFQALPKGIPVLDFSMRLMGLYLHFGKQAKYALGAIERTRHLQAKFEGVTPSSLGNESPRRKTSG